MQATAAKRIQSTLPLRATALFVAVALLCVSLPAAAQDGGVLTQWPDAGSAELDPVETEARIRETYAFLAARGIYYVQGALSCDPRGLSACGGNGGVELGRGWWVSPERFKLIDDEVGRLKRELYETQSTLAIQKKPLVFLGIGAAAGAAVVLILGAFLLPRLLEPAP